ncbi:MAG: GIY-YIG nuclease family protein [Alphaproteobacteria bacterium]|nr:GIY-YIG nuclease family protein [Alphaproteobacteria bacterium]
MIAADALPGEPGAYALTFRLDGPVTLPIATLDNPVFAAGDYVYAGSAFGPGGSRARVSRHLRADKKPHWHIDHLSGRAACIDVKTYPGRRECALVADMLAAGADVPVPGFGSADCRDCAAHLVRLAAGYQNSNIVNGVKQGKSDGSR